MTESHRLFPRTVLGYRTLGYLYGIFLPRLFNSFMANVNGGWRPFKGGARPTVLKAGGAGGGWNELA